MRRLDLDARVAILSADDEQDEADDGEEEFGQRRGASGRGRARHRRKGEKGKGKGKDQQILTQYAAPLTASSLSIVFAYNTVASRARRD